MPHTFWILLHTIAKQKLYVQKNPSYIPDTQIEKKLLDNDSFKEGGVFAILNTFQKVPI